MAVTGEGRVDEGEALARCLKRKLAGVAILDIGAMDAHGKEPALGVGQDMALAPNDLLARVVVLVVPF
jgi:prephenate dehydrogenase